MHDGALHQVDVAVVFELTGVQVFPAEASDEHRPTLEVSLVGQVVDGEHRRRTVQRPRPLDRVQVGRRQRRLPVVRVNDVGDETQGLAQLQRSSRQQREPFQVVRIRLPRRPVQEGSIKEAVVFQEVHRHVAAR